MTTVMERAFDDELVDRCDGCGGVLGEPLDGESLVIYDCFHVLHARCAFGRAACPRCDTPPEQIEAAPATSSPPENNPDEHSALVIDGVGVGNDDRPGGGETGEPRPPSRCDGDGESPASMSVPGCNHASRLACCAYTCSRRVAELQGRLEEKSAALIETTNVLASELERAQSRLCKIEKMYDKLEQEFTRLRNDKREREIEDAEEEEGEDEEEEEKEEEEVLRQRALRALKLRRTGVRNDSWSGFSPI